VPRRVRMPAADELFRSTAGNGTLLANARPEEPERERVNGGRMGGAGRTPETLPAQAQASRSAPAGSSAAPANGSPAQAAQASPSPQAAAPTTPAAPAAPVKKASAPRRPSGRERHDEKITVYVSPDELLGLEHARITLRGEYGVAVDRGRIVREAIAALLADLDARGPDSILVKRLSSGG
jgi:hypothetical protein